jgi:phytoene dehydrogenase-like protein
MADYVIAGSGINALVAASLLALKGRKVLVLERNPVVACAPRKPRYRASPMT